MQIKTFFYNRFSLTSDGASHRCNTYVEEVIIELGHKLHPCEPNPPHRRYKSLNYIPWDRRDRILRNQHVPSDVSIYCDRGIAYGLPSFESSKFNILLLHGLAYNYELIYSQSRFDLIITTSAYWAQVTRMMLNGVVIHNADELSNLLLSHRKGSNYPLIYSVSPPIENTLIACKSKLNEFMNTHELQDNSSMILAHALQPNKANYGLLVGTVISLSSLYGQEEKKFKIIVLEDIRINIKEALNDFYSKYNNLIDKNILIDEALNCFIFTKRLVQSQLHELFKICNFAFLYNDVPESFGMYALESVANRCPVFTNGAGNMRNALPYNKGLYIYETWDLYRDYIEEYQHLANFIRKKLEDKQIKQEIDIGADYIKNNYNLIHFKNQITHIIQTITQALDGVKTNLHKCKNYSTTYNYRISPLVRKIYVEKLSVIADHQFFTLSDQEMSVLCYINDKDSVSIETKFSRNEVIINLLLSKGLIIYD